MIQGIDYLDPVLNEMKLHWPKNRLVNIVCHGHSVPAGYFATPYVNTFSAYPHLLHCMVKERFPFAVTNVIVTAIGGENSEQGKKRFREEVLTHKPDILTIDYGLNDRAIGLESAYHAWECMINDALTDEIKVVLCTPTWDNSYYKKNEHWEQLVKHTEQIRSLADKYNVGLADSFEAYNRNILIESDLSKYLSHTNHPTKAGHQLVADEIAKYFIAR